MDKTILFALAALAGAPAFGAAPGSAQNFLERAERLKAKGPLALLDGDYGRLKSEGTAAGKSIAADRIAAEKAGKRASYCSPTPRAQLGSFEFIDGLEAIPAAERQRMTLKQAMLRVLQRKYPCRS